MSAAQISRKLILAHEGVRTHVYKDSLGIETIGCGRNVSLTGPGLRMSEIDSMLDNDINACLLDLIKYPFWSSLDDNRRGALIDMRFQLGPAGFSNFKHMIMALNGKQFDAASDAMLQSNWANQTPNRAKEIADIIRTGSISSKYGL